MTDGAVETVLAKLLLWQADAPKYVSDLEASSNLGLKVSDLAPLRRAMPDVLSEDRLTEFACPSCGSQVTLPKGAKSAYCEACASIWRKGKFPTRAYTLDRHSVENRLLERMRGELVSAGLKVNTAADPVRLLTSFGSVAVGIGIVARLAKLKDYHALRGSLVDPANSVTTLVAPHFDDVLHYYTRNTPTALLVDTMDWLSGAGDTALRLQEHAGQVSLSARVSDAIGTRFEELKLADDIGDRVHQLLRDLPLLSLQMSAGSASAIGNRFQRDTITALNAFTPLKILPVGGKDQEDGVLRFFFPGMGKRAQWYPVGIKSFKGDPAAGPYFRIRDAGEQIRKYARAYRQERSIADEVEIPAYLLIAHDFDMRLEETIQAVSAFEEDVGLPLKLLPVRSILAIVNGFLELRPDRVPDDPLVHFIQAPGAYLDLGRVETLLESIRRFQRQEARDTRIVRVRDRLREQHF